MRIGTGYDIHRLVEGRPLVLGGVAVPSERGEAGHSDGDALIHALIDALLGALCLGDIGLHFPPSDPRWKDADSRILLERTMGLVRKSGARVLNVDTTVILEAPRLRPHVDAIRASLASALGIALDRVSVKAKTKEGLDATGRGLAVEAQAAVLLELPDGGAGGIDGGAAGINGGA